VKLRRHGNNHVIEVRVEESALRYIETERRVIVITSQQVVWVVDQTRWVSVYPGELGRPDTVVGVLGLMDGEIRRPHSVMNNSLSVIPFLEVVAPVLLMCRMNFRSELH
jgi:hypothetical protein